MSAVASHDNLQHVRRRVAWLDRLQTLRRAALPLAAIGAILGVMVHPIFFPLVTCALALLLFIGSRRARAAASGLETDIERLQGLDLVQDAELAKLQSTVDRATRAHSSGWSSLM